ncbi:MAG: 4-diphosphocytidyl-2-C-methyl-D-erythritol kinase [Desulfovibrionales bacterium]|nr:4-diphosphocytidyl-2-C-methyl-D-erythritol kinase [Desulfovibrionales bacterium]
MSGEQIIRARPKVNLYLEITRVREDGYHELKTLFYPLPGPVDELSLSPGELGSGFSLDCGEPELCAPSNLVWKAYDAFAAATGFRPDVHCRLTKRIPSGAGLGGGSSDAAAMLLWLQKEAGTAALDEAALVQLAVRLGADVPFFLYGRPAWATGVGEDLTPSGAHLAGWSMVLVCPKTKVNTGFAFREWDRRFLETVEPGAAILTCGQKRDMDAFCPRLPPLRNSLEPAVFPVYPGLGRIKGALLSLGAAGAMMSGSGSSIFGLFRERSRAEFAVRSLASARIDVRAHHF